jgi:hypothetical protein
MDTPITLSEMKLAAAEATGFETDRITTITLQLDRLRREGFLLGVEVNGTGMFTTRASWAELGIPQDDAIRTTRLNRPTKNLIPEIEIEALRSCETSMRALLVEFGREIAGFKPYRWVPYTAHAEFRARWMILAARFAAIKQRILANYDTYRDGLADDFRQVAASAWVSIRAADRWPVIGATPYIDRDEFLDHVIATALAKFPSRAKIEANLKADYVPAIATTPLDYERARADAEMHAAELAAQKRVLKSQEDAAWAQASQAMTAAYKAKEDADLELQEKRMRLDAAFAIETAHAREQLADMISPFEELFVQLRKDMAQAAAEVAATIKTGKVGIHPKTVEKAQRMISIFDMMATHSDTELRKRLLDLKDTVAAAAAEETPGPNTEATLEALEDIRAFAVTAADDFRSGPTRWELLD